MPRKSPRRAKSGSPKSAGNSPQTTAHQAHLPRTVTGPQSSKSEVELLAAQWWGVEDMKANRRWFRRDDFYFELHGKKCSSFEAACKLIERAEQRAADFILKALRQWDHTAVAALAGEMKRMAKTKPQIADLQRMQMISAKLKTHAAAAAATDPVPLKKTAARQPTRRATLRRPAVTS